ncbi:MAG: cysteine--tRNA ligase, partial [Lachnospiraceae bacterium]|nr:cysteine--tRNA ligase [Lachnospiraceae bacterium]
HIGNARPMIVFDAFRRYLEHKGYEVKYVSNFTDVDDKIIKKSLEEGCTAGEVSEKFIKECKQDMESLNVRPATVHPKATEEIPGMIEMIDTLIKKDLAYPAPDGTVYYAARKFPGYGKLSHKNLDDLQSGNRELKVSGEEQKRDSLDFVLWKPKKEGEVFWESPWCDGRPGWHIECSVMSKKYLGEQIDIHAGGEDLVFPHHENEIAQSEGANGKPFAKYWMHNAFLNINNAKMSKSLGNFFTVREILEKYDPMVLRFFMLNAHYRSPLNFSEDLMQSAKASLLRIENALSSLDYKISSLEDENTPIEGEINTPREGELLAESDKFLEAFDEAMDDDCNTADAIAAIFDLVKFINVNMEGKSRAFLAHMKEKLLSLTDILGLKIGKEEALLDSDIEVLIEERKNARKAKDFARADEIRNELLAKGILLEDTREGVKWKRV